MHARTSLTPQSPPEGEEAAFFPQGIEGVIFDCDGVMIDSREANNLFYNRVLACFHLPPMTPAQEAYCFMATGMQALLHIVPASLHSQIARVLREEVVYERDILPLLRLTPGFLECLDDFRERGMRLAVHTNRTSWGIQRVLDIFSLSSYFSYVVAADTAEPKPSPEGTRRICAAWGCPASSVLFVGDSEHDRAAAAGAGVVFAALGDGSVRGRITVRDFRGLRAALQGSLPPRRGTAVAERRENTATREEA